MRRRYWIPGAALLALGLLLHFFVYGYSFGGFLVCLLALLPLSLGCIDALRSRFPRGMAHLRRIVWGLTALLLAAAVGTGLWIQTVSRGAAQDAADWVVVLGAGVNGTEPSASLRERLGAAEDYLQRNPEATAVLSGGMGEGEQITEARCMYDWLTARGVDPARLRLQEQASTTQENLRYSLDLIEAESGRRPEQLAVVSSDYHLLRAELLARRQGVQALGVPARTGNRLFFGNMLLREICGVWVTILFG